MSRGQGPGPRRMLPGAFSLSGRRRPAAGRRRPKSLSIEGALGSFGPKIYLRVRKRQGRGAALIRSRGARSRPLAIHWTAAGVDRRAPTVCGGAGDGTTLGFGAAWAVGGWGGEGATHMERRTTAPSSHTRQQQPPSDSSQSRHTHPQIVHCRTTLMTQASGLLGKGRRRARASSLTPLPAARPATTTAERVPNTWLQPCS